MSSALKVLFNAFLEQIYPLQVVFSEKIIEKVMVKISYFLPYLLPLGLMIKYKKLFIDSGQLRSFFFS